MNPYFNNHDLTMDNPVVALYREYLNDYPNQIPTTDEDYYIPCYIEEYEKDGKLCARLRDKAKNKKIVFWTSPFDSLAIEQKNGLLEFLSDTKRMNNAEFYKKDGTAEILVSAILLRETKNNIEVASYFAELFYSGLIDDEKEDSNHNYEIEQTLHPFTHEPLWRVKDISLPTGGISELVEAFINEFHHNEYTLSIFDNNTTNTIEIDCDLAEMPQIVDYIYHQEKAMPLTFIGLSNLSESYVVGMSLSRGRIEFGAYKFKDGKLLFIGK